MPHNVIRLNSAIVEAVKPILGTIRDLSHRRLRNMLEAVKGIRAQFREVGSPRLLPSVLLSRRLRPIIGFEAGMTLAGMAVIVAFAFIVWPLLSPTEPEARLIDGRLVRQTTGWVARVDQEGHLLQVSRSFLGFRREEFVVGQDATILIRDKEGGLGDLDKGMPVRVAWEKVGDTRRTLSIELVVGDSASPRVVSVPRSGEASSDRSRRTDAVSAEPTVAPPPLPVPGISPVARPEPTPPVEPPSPAVTATAHPAVSASAVVRPEVTRPAKPDSPAAAPMLDSTPAPPDTRNARRPGVSRRPASTVESVAPQVSPGSTDANPLDGSDAIDWLLENSRRR